MVKKKWVKSWCVETCQLFELFEWQEHIVPAKANKRMKWKFLNFSKISNRSQLCSFLIYREIVWNVMFWNIQSIGMEAKARRHIRNKWKKETVKSLQKYRLISSVTVKSCEMWCFEAYNLLQWKQKHVVTSYQKQMEEEEGNSKIIAKIMCFIKWYICWDIPPMFASSHEQQEGISEN